MFSLKLRMYLLLTVLFGIVYMLVTIIGLNMGVQNFYFYLVFSVALMLIQYMVGPKMVEWFMHVKYVTKNEYPELHQMVEELARKAGIPKPKVGIAAIAIPNAFAFGRGLSDGRVCVTEGILKLLKEDELRAVLGHELSHLKNRDVLTITILSVIPMVLYRIAWNFMFFGGNRRREGGGANAALVGLVALTFYFITNLLVLYASRIREYFADKGSVALGNDPSALASALYKLVYGSARADQDSLKEVEGLKAFFVNDPSQARNEIQELSNLDLDKSGTIDPYEMQMFKNRKINIGFGEKLMELMSTHPNMLKRIKQLSKY
ncbi:MAG: peptidase [Candidatus Omnitrophica bacterium CG1_02_44_16]|nr:MAG: peptidase [Candidatus Omnitrophica bacterium CG1_02_44_16]PIY83132.1 MAG: peptidase [Candidatus Omnitrophica bacterium CG_4_10_14_0_8_um_filter_44_12]PIZ83884.1 MAG: peptidase [Candidatus Omnitrophica bacterium CG_4_10_14_0_2_um_filter_44_9]